MTPGGVWSAETRFRFRENVTNVNVRWSTWSAVVSWNTSRLLDIAHVATQTDLEGVLCYWSVRMKSLGYQGWLEF